MRIYIRTKDGTYVDTVVNYIHQENDFIIASHIFSLPGVEDNDYRFYIPNIDNSRLTIYDDEIETFEDDFIHKMKNLFNVVVNNNLL